MGVSVVPGHGIRIDFLGDIANTETLLLPFALGTQRPV